MQGIFLRFHQRVEKLGEGGGEEEEKKRGRRGEEGGEEEGN